MFLRTSIVALLALAVFGGSNYAWSQAQSQATAFPPRKTPQKEPEKTAAGKIAKPITPSDQDDPIGRKLSEQIGPWPEMQEKREAWKKEYQRLTVDEKIHYCIFQLRNEDWMEWDFRGFGYETYSAEPERQPRYELIKLGRAAIPQLLLALDCEALPGLILHGTCESRGLCEMPRWMPWRTSRAGILPITGSYVNSVTGTRRIVPTFASELPIGGKKTRAKMKSTGRRTHCWLSHRFTSRIMVRDQSGGRPSIRSTTVLARRAIPCSARLTFVFQSR